jgi:sugar lactone lactonase YvrE
MYPVDVASSAAGTIYAVDNMSKKLMIYNSNQQLISKVDAVAYPVAVAVSGNTVYVADTATRSVKILNSGGTVVGELKKDRSTAKFKLARNITVDASGAVYVVDQFRNKIDVFDGAGEYSYTISGLNQPQDAIVVGSELFIIDQPMNSTDTINSTGLSSLHLTQVRIYDLATQAFVEDELRTFPANGLDTAAGQYMTLKAIAADPHNNLYLTDAYLHVIYKYDTNGQFLGIIDEPMDTPQGAAVTPDGRLAVCSAREAKIKVLGVDYEAGQATWLNDAPLADAGADQVVSEGGQFALDGSGSFDEDGIINYKWTQTAGPPVLPSNPYDSDTAGVSLTAPMVDPMGMTLVFQLVVTDSQNKTGTADTIQVTVNNIISGSVVINNGELYTNDQVVNLLFDSPEADTIRLANEDEPFGDSISYSNAVAWSLSAYDPSVEANTKTVRVEFKDAGGNITEASSSILLDMQAPDAPVPVTGGAAGDFTWIADDGAASYTLQYAFNSDFSDAVIIKGLTHNEATIGLEGLEYGTWYWRVAATDEAGNTGDWSTVSTFVVVPPNYPPVADAGENQAVKENAVFTLDASNSSDDKGIVSYTWTQTAGTAVLPEDPLVTTAATVELTAPAVGPLNETLVFELVVSDASDETATAATTVTVTNVISGSLLINDGAYITGDRSVTLSLDAQEAIEMRFANDSEAFEGDFIPYSENALWTIGAYDASIPENIKTVRVEFRDVGGNTAVVSDAIRLDMTPPEIPLINGDSAGGYFEWDPIAAATGYNLQYSFNSDFSDAVTLTNIRRTNTFVTLDGIENFGACYWRVQTIDAAGNISAWSEDASFNVAANCAVIVPAVPQLSWPLYNAVDISRTVLLETGDIDYPAACGVHDHTVWQVSTEYDFGLLQLHVNTQNYPTMYQVSQLMLDYGTKYYWRAKHVANTGKESAWSAIGVFTTAAGEDIAGVDGIILDGSTTIKRGSISLKQPVGDSGVKLNSISLLSDTMVPLLIKEIDPATITDTENRPSGFPYGLLSYRIAVEPGGFVDMEMNFDDEAPLGGAEINRVYTHEDGWHDNPNIIYQENGRLLLIFWQDGGAGDADGIENGFIVNP